MTREEAHDLLDLARSMRWDFPSSAGRPLRTPADAERSSRAKTTS
jgi:hypothetical protein